MLGKKVLNLGFAGAGPETFLNKSLLDKINQSKIAVIQIMSGRSVSTSRYQTIDGNRVAILRKNNTIIQTPEYLTRLIYAKDHEQISEIVIDIRKNWIKYYNKLLSLIKVPKILFYIGKHVAPNNIPLDFSNYRNLTGGFPQFVNAEMLESIKKNADGYVEHIYSIKQPRLIKYIDSNNVAKLKKDAYYPSPEIHIEASKKLFDLLNEF